MTPTGRSGRRAGGWLPTPPTRSAPAGRRSPASPGTRPAPITTISRPTGWLGAPSRWPAKVRGGSCCWRRRSLNDPSRLNPDAAKRDLDGEDVFGMDMADRARPVARAGELALAGALIALVLATAWQALLAPPAAWAGARLAVIHFRGRAVRTPASWPVYRLAAHPGMCVRLDRRAVYLGRPAANQRCSANAVGRRRAILLDPGATAPAAGLGRARRCLDSRAARRPRPLRAPPSPGSASMPAPRPPCGRCRPGLPLPIAPSASTSAASTAPAPSPT